MKIQTRSPLGAVALTLAAALPAAALPLHAQDPAPALLPETVVSATRDPLDTARVPSAVTVLTAEEMERKQLFRVADALRTVPGVSVVQTGAPGQLTSVFIRGLTSEATQVLRDGVPINQGLAGLYNFADLTTENLERIEVIRGPQSALYGPRAGGGVINLIPNGSTPTFQTTATVEGGSFFTFRESATAAGQLGKLDFSAGISRLDSNGHRRNGEYRATSGLVNVGFTPFKGLRIFTLASYSLDDTGNPNSIFTPKFTDNLLTERWMIAPGFELQATDWWKHRLITDYDEERQLNSPNLDGFVGDTRGAFKRYQLDYQNEIAFSRWAKFTSGFFYSRVEAEQERPFSAFPPTFISDKTENQAVFGQLQLEPIPELLIVASGRYDHFSQFGGIATYRVAGNFKMPWTGTILRSSVGSGFNPPSPQDKIFGNNFLLDPNQTRGFDIGIEQALFQDRVRLGANFFRNKMTNVIGFDGLFRTLNLGSAQTQGIEVFLEAHPLQDLTLSFNYTYLDTEKTSVTDIQQPPGSRLPRRPRNELWASIDYRFFGKLRTGLGLKYVNGREELSFGAPNFDIEDYTTLRLWAEYEINPHFKLFGRIENLTGEEYAEVFGFPNPGRAYYGGISLRF